jgi:PAS domain S-box-containing protein
MSQPVEDATLPLAAVVAASCDAIIGLTADFLIASWNPAAERLFGYPAAEAIGQPASLLSPIQAHHEQTQALTRVAAGDAIPNFETVCRAKDGATVPVALALAPVRNGDGAVTGIAAIARRVERRHRSDRAAARLAAIVESSDDAIVSKDLNGIVTSWNHAAERMFGYSAAEMIGASIRTIVPGDRQSEEDDVLAHVRRGEKVDHFETLRRRKDGTLIPISLTVSPVRDEHGIVVGASKIARDISEARQHAAITAKINEVGAAVASTLDRDVIVQAVTDAATSVTGAEFGAFFYNVVDPASGDAFQLYTLSGASIEAFAKFPHPRATAIFAPTFRGERIVRLADVTKDARYGHNPPYNGMPAGHLPVRSYLAVPVKSPSGDVFGGLFLGHSAVGVFSEQHEQLASGIAAWASVALENAKLYVSAQDANRVKDEFLATLSHELRTPLNAIVGYTRMLRSGVVSGDKQERAIATIDRNARVLTQMVEDVLDVSRIVSGKLRLERHPVDVATVTRHALDAVLPIADAKGVHVDLAVDAGPAVVSADPARLQQVIWNVISNAVKFTERGGRVDVRVSRRDGDAEVVVKDSGIGIAAEFLPFVFERFRQGDAGPTRAHGGLGLGLSIARHLIEMHGGTIAATSEGAGRGAMFRIALPLDAPSRSSA